MKTYIWEDQQSATLKIVFYREWDGQMREYIHPTESKIWPNKLGENIPEDFVIKMPLFGGGREALKDIAEFLDKKGIRPEDEAIRKGELIATKNHLEDMRRIVFDPGIFYGHDKEVTNANVPSPEERL